MCWLLGDLVDQGTERLTEPGIVERGTPLISPRSTFSFEDAYDQRLLRRTLLAFG
jgi:hypothetical protein